MVGGQSLQAVAALGRIQALPGLDTTAITEIFRFPVLVASAGDSDSSVGAPWGTVIL